MQKELEAILKSKNIDVLWISGRAQHNPAMVFFTGIAHLTQADLIMPREGEAVLFHGPMERDEAARTGFKTRSYSQYPLMDYLTAAAGNRDIAMALRYKKMLEDAGIRSGRVALYGLVDLNWGYGLFSALQKVAPEIELVGFQQDEILMHAMMVKDENAIAHIRNMGRITTEVVGETADFLSSCKVKDGVLLNGKGEPLTIGEVKANIDLWLAKRGAENPESTIFAIGRDAGVPHSSGTPSDWMRLGQTIVYDIYPCEAGGGYFYDFTRTWCLGYAPDEVQKLYEQVLSVYNTVVSELKVNEPFVRYQRRTCDLFEAMGHPTIQSTPAVEKGYVHSLGHGVGLNIHEKPFSGSTSVETDILAPGSVFTIEPGLYYPEQGMGVRLEDTYWTRPDGTFEMLAEYPKQLVLPVKG